MDDYLKEALEITRAQAGVRVMSEEEIATFIQKVAQGIRAGLKAKCAGWKKKSAARKKWPPWAIWRRAWPTRYAIL